MIQYLKPSFWRYALRDPLTWVAIAVDIIPIYFVITFGWGATALVLLYWAENIVIGVAAFARIVLAGFASLGLAGIASGLFLGAFFTFHYGLFCFGHGAFVFGFAKGVDLDIGGPGPGMIGDMFMAAANYAPGMALMLVLIAIYQLIALVKDYWPEPGKPSPNPMVEMFSPYGRIVVLHVAIIGGAFLMVALGDPMLGVFLLIALRAAFSVIGRVWRDKKDIPGKGNEVVSST